MVPYSLDGPALALVPARNAGVQDERARFREIFCTVLETHKDALPDYRTCEDALTRVGTEPAPSGKPVNMQSSRRHLVAAIVPGFGYDCFEKFLDSRDTVASNLRDNGYDLSIIDVEGLSGTQRNARLIRDALMQLPAEPGPPRIVLIGYSKGANDILEALVAYPEMRSRLAAVVSVAGAIGGSPLAYEFDQDLAEWLRYFPGATCPNGDRGAVASLRPATRQMWMARNTLPQDLPYYSLVTLPDRERISAILDRNYKKLARIDPRNDSQMISHDQIIPGSTLVGYVNADHWAVVLPIARTHGIIATFFVTRNNYPREALAEALLRFVEEDLDQRDSSTATMKHAK
ncbi:MAG: hypothetical protein PVH25_14420 [Burkholderiales bacterium]